jgi:FHA domain-containing protein/cysteine-rich secretory family protein
MLKRAQAARLLAVNQPARGTRRLILGRGEAVIGSAGASALQIAEASVAKSHAVISRRRGRYVVSDLKSAGGTFVNDKRVRRRRILKHRDSIRFGAANVYRFIDADSALRRCHRRITEMVLVLMICAAGWGAHLMKWDGGLPSIAAIADFVAWEQATPNHAQAQADRSAVAATGVASATMATGGLHAPTAANKPIPIAAAGAGPASATSESASLAPPWLEQLNHYRLMAGLATLHEDRQLSASVAAHAHYMTVNFGADIRGGNPLGAATHGEDPNKSGYTLSGSSSAENSQFAWGCGSLDAKAQIDQWIAGPFHRIAMLNPFMTQAGFGEASADECWVAALRLPPPPEEVKPYSHAIEFPPDGATVVAGLAWSRGS